jgi:suppressor for copper-sensitivity B
MRFDFAASENVAAAEPLFPVPARLTEAGEEVIGYQGVAGFPIRIALAGRPAQLAVHVELGLCREICQGVELDLSRPLGQPDDPAAARRFVAALPRRAADAGVAIRAAVSPEGDGVVVHVQAPRPLDRPDLFLEARPEDSYAAQPLELAADRRSATFRLDAERTLAPGERVTVILVSGGEGFEEALALAPP